MCPGFGSKLCSPCQCSLVLAGHSRLHNMLCRGHPMCHILGGFWEGGSWSLQDWGSQEIKKKMGF